MPAMGGPNVSAATLGGFAQQPMHAPMYGPFSQQQYSQYQQHPQLYQQHQQQQQHQLQMLQQQQQQQQALQYQQMSTSQHHMQQQAQQLALNQGSSGGSHRSVQRVASSGSQRGTPSGPSVTDFGLTPHDVAQGSQLMPVPSQGSLQDAAQEASQEAGQQMTAGSQVANMPDISQMTNQTAGVGQGANSASLSQQPKQALDSTHKVSSVAEGT